MSVDNNVLIVHWHDLGRYLGAYGHTDVESPRLDALAAEGILFTRAHATAPLCSPSRGSLFTGRYPQIQWTVGVGPSRLGIPHRGAHPAPDSVRKWLAHSAYSVCSMRRASRPGWVSTSSTSPTPTASTWWRTPANGSREAPQATPKFLLTAGFFETHRPYPHDRYEPADPPAVTVPDYLPDTPHVRQDLADFYGSITVADAAVGQLLDTLAETGLDQQHLGRVHDRPRPGAAAGQVHAL